MRESPVLQLLCTTLPFAVTIVCVAGSACSRSEKGRAPDQLEQAIVGSLGRVLGVEVSSLDCPELAGQAGVVCTGRIEGGEEFAVDVTAVDGQAEPAWMPRGRLKFEYQIALGFADAVRAAPSRVSCPEEPDELDVSKGFECSVELPDHPPARVTVAADAAGDRFVWTSRDVLMLGAIEDRIAHDLGQDAGRGSGSGSGSGSGPGSGPRGGRADCGRAVQAITPGRSFRCAVELADGTRRIAIVSILDGDGHVQYRIEEPPDESPPQSP